MKKQISFEPAYANGSYGDLLFYMIEIKSCKNNIGTIDI